MFDYVYIDDLLVTVRKVTGLGAPTPRRDVYPRASSHGARDLTRYYEGRVVTLEGILAGASENATWVAFDLLKSKLQLGTKHTLKFRRPGFVEDDQVVEVIVASPVEDNLAYDQPGIIPWGVSLHAPDPRLYGAILRSGSYDPAATLSGGGAALPLVMPIVFTTTTATHLELVNDGNALSPPTLTIRGPVVNPALDNDTTSETIQINYTLGANDTIVVDVAARDLLLNGASRKDLIDIAATTWWEMAPGTNRLRARGTGMSIGATLFTCQYRNARI